MDEELKLFQRKAAKLQDILKSIKQVQENQAEILDKKLESICTLVRKDGTLNAGGKFEWVDSVLIKVFENCII